MDTRTRIITWKWGTSPRTVRSIWARLSDPSAPPDPDGEKEPADQYVSAAPLLDSMGWKLTVRPGNPGDPVPKPGRPGSPLVPLHPSNPGGPLSPGWPGWPCRSNQRQNKSDVKRLILTERTFQNKKRNDSHHCLYSLKILALPLVPAGKKIIKPHRYKDHKGETAPSAGQDMTNSRTASRLKLIWNWNSMSACV